MAQNERLNLELIGMDYQSACPEIREKVHLSSSRIDEIYRQGLLPKGTVILATCNRTEFYFWNPQRETTMLHPLQQIYPELDLNKTLFYHLKGKRVLLHLMELAVGLKSMLIGETEVLGQIQASFQRTADMGECSPDMLDLFRKVIIRARQIREKTQIGGHSSAIPTLLIKELKREWHDLSKYKALLLGSGTMARQVAQALVYQGVQTAVIMRSRKSRPMGMSPGINLIYGYENLRNALPEYDLVVAATAAPHFLLKKEHFESLKGKTLVDLSFPKNIDPDIAMIHGSRFLDLEYFGQISRRNQVLKKQAIDEASRLCAVATEKLSAGIDLEQNIVQHYPIINSA